MLPEKLELENAPGRHLLTSSRQIALCKMAHWATRHAFAVWAKSSIL